MAVPVTLTHGQSILLFLSWLASSENTVLDLCLILYLWDVLCVCVNINEMGGVIDNMLAIFMISFNKNRLLGFLRGAAKKVLFLLRPLAPPGLVAIGTFFLALNCFSLSGTH